MLTSVDDEQVFYKTSRGCIIHLELIFVDFSRGCGQ